MKDFVKNNWQILIIECLILLAFIVFYGKFGDLIVDSFREAYIPMRVADGKALYKDIFTIYAPFAYLFNAILMKIFNNSLFILHFAGLLCTMGIFYLTYKISNLFLDKNYSFAICMFTFASLVLSPNVFNSFFPYSYGIIYGILFALLSIYFALKEKYPLAYLFYSLAICSKYEFLFLLPLLIYWSGKKDLIKNIIAFSSPILLNLSFLALLGTHLGDIKTSLELILIMSKTNTLNWFYTVSGLIFKWQAIPIYITSIIKVTIPLGLLIAVQKYYKLLKENAPINTRIIALVFIAIVCSLIIFNSVYQEVIIYAFPLILTLLIIRFKDLNKQEKFFLIASLLISIKVFFALAIQSYGTYFIPFALISIFILTPQNIRKPLFIITLMWAISIGGHNYKALQKKDFSSLNYVANYIKEQTQPTDKVVVYPECLGINVLSKRESDDKFYSLIPLYVETFGEDIIIKRLEITKPEYIIINNYDTSAYYFKEFGKDYAREIYNWIENNYRLDATIIDNWTFKIYKK